MKYTTYNLQWLLNKVEKKENVKYLFFWGHVPSKDGSVTASCFSQWWHDGFTVDDIYYKTAEHWMMAKKAELFSDTEMLEKILIAKSPAEAKQLGRQVRNFDPVVWGENCFDIVCEGNYHKFSQHENLKEFLQSTKNRIIVEASPRDRIWGIGMGKSNENAERPQLWRGKNLLGFALMEVRDRIR
ncbi:ribA/ribD-fused uncharacterized protein [Dysgonomonas sp. PFB1-18]|uniref:NADAR family protein n=1 Tax=unclassified Dysgonomonas TaxID=2630389 RepID=UPI00247694E6|nr:MULTISPECIES: NADAR family protein [unclassified Dysgonomonas]MDH6308922.1 ribA/ribD-fused uncharacterized protein [Dysgonomonas sp. PF1-14]MDH6338673.1 ribA/ribD-fused uncharacterized protein [Dysgonomonas sp. PF1-16]MDH6380299.1 ribA/ribD-fused uncharacterized protein [Dysgonomonas sp. PFB1-18]MDH6397629.1 ribA/ribD-fused uncharacterized protein [Dysgonomonas sp. PF1-23]